jgi:hypothetical protein
LIIAVLNPKSVSGKKGAAENLYSGLVTALKNAGHTVTQLEIPVISSSCFQAGIPGQSYR